MSDIKVLIVEDEPIVAENIAWYLNTNDFSVAGIAYHVASAIELIKTTGADVALLDVNLGDDEDGIDLALFINKHHSIPVVFLTSYSEKETLERAKKVQPGGYLIKPFNERSLVAALEIAVSNFAAKITSAAPVLSIEKINRHLLSPVSTREFEVLELIYQGKTNQQIAQSLFLSINTIKKHINSAYLKLDVESRTTAIARLLTLMTR